MAEKLETIERLENEIYDKDCKIEKLEEKLENIDYEDTWKWRHIRELSKEENKDLPVPRLEIRYRNLDKFNHVADYGLVYEHLMGEILFVPFGSTKCGNSKSLDEQALPFRDGSHIKHDAYFLKLPAFLVSGDKVEEVDLKNERNWPNALYSKIKSR